MVGKSCPRRLFQHSCDPCLMAVSCRQRRGYFRLVFFARRHIYPGETATLMFLTPLPLHVQNDVLISCYTYLALYSFENIDYCYIPLIHIHTILYVHPMKCFILFLVGEPITLDFLPAELPSSLLLLSKRSSDFMKCTCGAPSCRKITLKEEQGTL